MKPKRLGVLLFTACLLVSCIFISVSAAENAVVDEGTCGQNVKWVLSEDGTITISGNGAMDDLISDARPWENYLSKIYTVVVEDGVTRIGKCAFINGYVTSVIIGNSVTEICDWSFANCHDITTLKLGKNVKTIGEGAFLQSSSLTSLELPEGLTHIGIMAFHGSTIRTVTIPASVTNIDIGAFDYCASLKDVYYGGTSAQWEQLSIPEYNQPLLDATLHTAHAWDAGTVTKQPSCTETGEKTYTCTDCGDTKAEPIDIVPHTYDNACDVSCNVCSMTRTTTHTYSATWSSSASNHWRECSVCGQIETAAHTPGAAATEKTSQICTVCDYIITPKLGHTHQYGTTWDTDNNYHWHVCACGNQSDKAEHSWNSGKDNKDGTITYACKVCAIKKTKQKPVEQPEATLVETEPTIAMTEPTIVTTEPTLTTTEPSVADTVFTEPTEPVLTDERPPESLWAVVAGVAVLVACGGAAAAVILIRKKKGA